MRCALAAARPWRPPLLAHLQLNALHKVPLLAVGLLARRKRQDLLHRLGQQGAVDLRHLEDGGKKAQTRRWCAKEEGRNRRRSRATSATRRRKATLTTMGSRGTGSTRVGFFGSCFCAAGGVCTRLEKEKKNFCSFSTGACARRATRRSTSGARAHNATRCKFTFAKAFIKSCGASRWHVALPHMKRCTQP